MNSCAGWETVDTGVTRRIFPVGQALMMMEVRFEGGAVGAEHSHPHEQMTYCLAGSFEFRVSGVTTVVRAGETIHIPGGATHSVKALEDSALLDTFTPIREDLVKR